MSWRVTPELKKWIDGEAARNGRSTAQEIEIRLEQSRDFDAAFCGPGTRHLFQHAAQIGQIYFPNEAYWLTDRIGWDLVFPAWVQALDARAPPAITREERVARTRRLIDELRITADPDRREHLVWILMNLAQDEWLPIHVRDEAFGAASIARPVIAGEPPAPDPSVEQLTEAGRGIAAEFARATDPRRREHLRERLAAMARLPGLAEDVREEFSRAAESPIVRLPPSTPPSGPARDEWRPPHVSLFDAAWLIAQTRARQLSSEPDKTQIGEAFAADPTLFAIAGMAGVARTAGAVLAYRDWIEEQRPKARPSPPSKPQTAAAETASERLPPKRRRAAR